MFTRLTFNLTNAPIRHETLQGRAYLVAPLAMITEGVHTGSGGALLYKEAELKRAIPSWNMKPIVVYHPELDGRGVSACDPIVLEKQQVGVVMNTRWAGGKLRAEAWIEESRAAAVDNRVIEALEKNKLMEVSTGLFTENVGAPGKWKEVDYVAEAINHQPDHLALLPDQIGACSIADGAGLLQLNEAAIASNVDVTRLMAREMDVLRRAVGNAMSNQNTTTLLSAALRERYKNGLCYVVDVYPDFFIYECEGQNGTGMKLYKLGYTATKDDVTIDEGTPEEVVRVNEYRTADKGKFVGNEARTNKEKSMDRKKIIDGLIANGATSFEEADRAVLEKQDDATLLNFNKAATPKKKKATKKDMDDDEGNGASGAADDGDVPYNNAAATEGDPDGDEEDNDEEDADSLKGKGKKKGKKKATANAAPRTAREYVDAAPAEIRDMLANGLAVHDAEKAKCVDLIVANKQNKFSKEFLATKGLGELQGLAALAAGNTEATAANTPPAMFFGGQATPPGLTANTAADEGPLLMPVMNFERSVREAKK